MPKTREYKRSAVEKRAGRESNQHDGTKGPKVDEHVERRWGEGERHRNPRKIEEVKQAQERLQKRVHVIGVQAADRSDASNGKTASEHKKRVNDSSKCQGREKTQEAQRSSTETS